MKIDLSNVALLTFIQRQLLARKSRLFRATRLRRNRRPGVTKHNGESMSLGVDAGMNGSAMQ
jgi:hypothetical protein